jgi:hypothetical protein
MSGCGAGRDYRSGPELPSPHRCSRFLQRRARPADGTGDGVLNSFFGRAIDATTRMSSALSVASPSGHFLNWIGTISSTNTAAIAFRIRELDYLGTGVLGVVEMSTGCSTMHDQPPAGAFPPSVYADIDVRSNWFTQDDSRRALWEACPSDGYSPTYTCSKKWDAGGVMLHELGHAVGLAHPQTTDAHTGNSLATQDADCSVWNDQATMCSSLWGMHRSHWRTLHQGDTDSLGWQY